MNFFILIKFKLSIKIKNIKFSAPFYFSFFCQNLTCALVFLLSTACPAFATDVSQSFTYQGRFYNSAGTAPLSDIVDLVLDVYNPGGTCLLYEETQANIDLTATNGLFAVQVGSVVGDARRSGGSDPGLTMAQVFTNSSTQIRAAGGNCLVGYTPAVGDSRVLRVTVTPHSTLVPSTLVPDQIIGSQTTSLVAQTLQGLASGDFIQSAAGVAGQAGVSLATLTTLTGGSSTDASALHNHDSLYVKLSGGGSTSNLGSGIAYTTGSLGVGTAVPTADIGLGGTTTRTIQVERNSVANNAGNNLILLAGGATSGGTDKSGGNLILSSGTSTGAGSSGIQFNTASSGTAGTTDRTPSTKMTLTADGRLGVGTQTPGAQVEIDASGSTVKGQIIQGAVSQSGNLLEFQNSTSSVLSYFDAAGYLTLPGDPTSALQPATKQYVTGLLTSGAVSSFNTRTGAVVLTSGDVSTALTYTPLNQAGDTLIGPLILAANPTSALGAATQQYVTGLLAGKQDTGSYLTALTGDVTASGSGSVAATVATVGGSSAANIHTAELAANAATANNTASKIVARDPSGNFIASTVTASLIGNVAGNVTGNLTGSVTGNVSGNVTGDVSGNVTGSAAGNVLKAGDTMTGLLVLSANPSDNFGAVTKKYVDDINTSLNATITGTTSSLTLTFTPPLVNTAGNVKIAVGSTSSDGYLSSGDWTTFNNKQSFLGYSPVNRAGDTVSGPLTLSGSGTSLTTLGNVGIGKTNPASQLDVVGNVSATGTVTAATFVGAFTGNTSGNATNVTGTVAVANGGTGLISGISGGIPYFSSTSTMTSSALLVQYGIVLGSGAGLAPGTLSPSATSGQPLLSQGSSANPAYGTINLASSSIVNGTLPVANGGTGVVTSTGSGNLVLSNTPTLVSPVLGAATGTSLALSAAGTSLTTVGNVGIGTAAPSANLQVAAQGTSAASVLIGQNGGSGGYTALNIYLSQQSGGYSALQGTSSSGSAWGNIALNSAGGNVGIGITNPGAALEVNGSAKVSGSIGVNGATPGGIAQGQATGLNVTGYTGLNGLRIKGSDTNTLYNGSNDIGVVADSGRTIFLGQTSTGFATGLSVYTSSGNAYLSGKLGIGTTTPQATLDVNGGINQPEGGWYQLGSDRYVYSNKWTTGLTCTSSFVTINVGGPLGASTRDSFWSGTITVRARYPGSSIWVSDFFEYANIYSTGTSGGGGWTLSPITGSGVAAYRGDNTNSEMYVGVPCSGDFGALLIHIQWMKVSAF